MIADMDNEYSINLPGRPDGMTALYGPDCVALALALTAQIGVRHAVWVIDGGNRFDALWVADYLARRGVAPEPALARIRVSRAFTCHQMAERVLALPDASSAAGAPLVMLNLLDTFYDENVPLDEARRLLNRLWPVLRRRSRAAPVVITLRPPRSERVAERERFFGTCLSLADRRVGPAAAEAPQTLPLPLEGEAAGAAKSLRPGRSTDAEEVYRPSVRYGRGGDGE